MKLNLLPTHVATQSKAPVFAGVGAVVALGAIALAVFLQISSTADLKAAKQELADSKQAAADALATANHADEIAKKGTIINTNLLLAKAMQKHNSAYVELYESIMPYIPDFYRVTSMSAASAGADTSTVTLVGQIKTFRQYADVALAFWRVPGVTNVQRSGYVVEDPSLSGINETYQKGSMVKPGEAPLSDDPETRLEEMIARASSAPQGYQGVGGFGQEGIGAKGAMPGWSTVTMVLTIAKDLRTPDPRGTLSGAGGGGGAGTGGGPGRGNPFGPPTSGGPGGARPPGVPPPSGPASGAPTGRRGPVDPD